MEAKKKFVINAAFYGTILGIFLLVYRYILPIMMPFIVGFCIAALVQLPLKRIRLKSFRHRRLLSGGLCILFYAILVGLLFFFGASVVAEIGDFARTLPDLFQNQLYPFFVEVADRIQEVLDPIDRSLADWIIELGKTVAQSLGRFATDLSASAVKLVANGAVSIPGIVVQIIIAVVSSFYIAADYDKILALLTNLIPAGKRSFIIDVLHYAKTAVGAFIKSYSILFLVTFLELWMGLLILRIPYALGIAFGIALFDLMPILGTGGILLPWAVIALIMGNFSQALGVAVLYIVITIVRNALEARIVGSHIGLHPLATLVAMILGLRLMGLLGMLLFPICLVAVTNLKKGVAQPHA